MNTRPQTWFGQPRGLTILFLTEMWEIFSYYGMRALLVYYMTKQLLIGQEKASLIYGVYVGDGVLHADFRRPHRGSLARQAARGDHRRQHHGRGPFHDGIRTVVLFRTRDHRVGQWTVLPELAQPNRRPVSARRSAPQLGLQRLLRRHQSRRLLGSSDLRHARRALRLALGIRRRRSRDAGRTPYLCTRRQVSAGPGAREKKHAPRPLPRARKQLPRDVHSAVCGDHFGHRVSRRL